MAGPNSSPGTRYTGRLKVETSISIRTILLVAATVAAAWALVSIADVLLMIFVSIFSVAVLLPGVNAMERRFGWSRARCAVLLESSGS